MKVLLIVLIAFVAGSNADVGKDSTYKIQNVHYKDYLTVPEDGTICKSLGPVFTVNELKVADFEKQIWTTTWWGDEQEAYGIHLHHIFTGNQLTFADYPPYCYLVYTAWKFEQFLGNIYTMEDRDAGKCLTGKGNGHKVQFETCDKENPSQQWEFYEVAHPK